MELLAFGWWMCYSTVQIAISNLRLFGVLRRLKLISSVPKQVRSMLVGKASKIPYGIVVRVRGHCCGRRARPIESEVQALVVDRRKEARQSMDSFHRPVTNARTARSRVSVGRVAGRKLSEARRSEFTPYIERDR